MVPSVVDIAGLNSLLRIVLENEAAAMVAMTKKKINETLDSKRTQLRTRSSRLRSPFLGLLHLE